MNLQHLQQVSPDSAIAELQARRLARSNLLDFTRYTFPDYEVNWHHRVLCNYLDKFISGAITRLIVTMPPQHGKSELISCRTPALGLGINPDLNFMVCSYADSLAADMNRNTQRIIESDEYRRLFPDTRLYDRNIRTVAKGTYLRNNDVFEIVNHRGAYRNRGVGGGITGKGFDRGIIDDPIKDAKEANSPTIRRTLSEWYDKVFWTRQRPGAGICFVMTRWRHDDLVGEQIDAMIAGHGENWVILNIPARLDSLDDKHPNDPRSLGEYLWTSRYPVSFYESIESKNKYAFAALYQQKPIPEGAGLFDTSKIEIIDSAPPKLEQARFYDLAVTAKKTSDYTAGVLMGIDKDEIVYILDVYRVQKTPVQVEDGIVQNAMIDGTDTPIRLEAEKAGIMQLDYLLKNKALRGYVLDAKPPQGDKYTRAQPYATRVNLGKVKMIRANWNRAYIDELDTFPLGAHDDMVDASSGAYDMLATVSPIAVTRTRTRTPAYARRNPNTGRRN